VENFPGFPEGIDGPQLVMNMHAQAEKFGARFSYAEATDFETDGKTIRLKIDDDWTERSRSSSRAARRHDGSAWRTKRS
jgi:thioredoxin reductase (NADPH)